jgi:hypothetical protein
MAFTSEPIRVVEIVQPLCSRVFGSSPCLATGDKCWNTDKTCKFRSALDMTDSLSLFFVEPGVYDWQTGAGAYQPATAIPSLVSYQAAPTVLNVASGSKNKGPLGYRAVASVKIKDHPWNDVGTDPYIAGRSYDPDALGTFWSKWLSRNPFHIGYTLRIYEGELGQALADMTMREYVIEKIDAGRDGVSITAKDVLRRITETGITAPALSPGELSSDITIDAADIVIAGAVEADYPASGTVRIGDELISYTLRTVVNADIVLTGCTRGARTTEAATHSQEDRVQRVLIYTDTIFSDILYDLLTVWGGISTAYIDDAAWDAEAIKWRPDFRFDVVISVPTKIDDLAGEISLQSQSHIWWDERTPTIKLKAQHPDEVILSASDDGDILAGSLSIKERPEERVSQVFVYYNLRGPTDDHTKSQNYTNAVVYIDVDAQQQFGGEVAIRELYCRFIQTDALAINMAANYLNRFRNVRREITFSLGPQGAETFWTGDSLDLTHYLDVDFTGAARVGNWLITSANATDPGSQYKFVAEDNDSAGIYWEWVDEAVYPLTWAAASAAERDVVGYWLDDDGNDAGGTPQKFRWI